MFSLIFGLAALTANLWIGLEAIGGGKIGGGIMFMLLCGGGSCIPICYGIKELKDSIEYTRRYRKMRGNWFTNLFKSRQIYELEERASKGDFDNKQKKTNVGTPTPKPLPEKSKIKRGFSKSNSIFTEEDIKQLRAAGHTVILSDNEAEDKTPYSHRTNDTPHITKQETQNAYVPKTKWEIGTEYEQQVQQWFKQNGYKVVYHQWLDQIGIDFIAERNDQTHLVQCKKWSMWSPLGKPGYDIIAKLNSVRASIIPQINTNAYFHNDYDGGVKTNIFIIVCSYNSVTYNCKRYAEMVGASVWENFRPAGENIPVSTPRPIRIPVGV